MKNSPYLRFILMTLFSGVSMYITMYFNTYEWDHVYWSWTRFYMTLIGIGGMALVMFFFMRKHYENRKKNLLLVFGSITFMILSTVLVRKQYPIEEVRWMKAMIPHHSIAVLTSNRAEIKDPEVKDLSKRIIEAQVKEIAEMKKMIQRLEENRTE